jgi:hypothetical protein
MRRRRAPLAVILGAALWLAAGAALADEASAPEVDVPQTPAPELKQETAPALERRPLEAGGAFTGRVAREDWQSRRPWHYGTQQLFPLTRGMAEAGIPAPLRWPLYPFTVAFDTGNAVFGAIAGLYGN